MYESALVFGRKENDMTFDPSVPSCHNGHCRHPGGGGGGSLLRKELNHEWTEKSKRIETEIAKQKQQKGAKKGRNEPLHEKKKKTPNKQSNNKKLRGASTKYSQRRKSYHL